DAKDRCWSPLRLKESLGGGPVLFRSGESCRNADAVHPRGGNRRYLVPGTLEQVFSLRTLTTWPAVPAAGCGMLPPFGRKCHPCFRYKLSPMCQAVHFA